MSSRGPRCSVAYIFSGFSFWIFLALGFIHEASAQSSQPELNEKTPILIESLISSIDDGPSFKQISTGARCPQIDVSTVASVHVGISTDFDEFVPFLKYIAELTEPITGLVCKDLLREAIELMNEGAAQESCQFVCLEFGCDEWSLGDTTSTECSYFLDVYNEGLKLESGHSTVATTRCFCDRKSRSKETPSMILGN
ncbi:MAG: hypothetical protein KDD70_16365 [Bdellovibrionales bacterium]|nr:hypothetical protein [Bdellovibrionales bacterium]